jgi:hypothetical protein
VITTNKVEVKKSVNGVEVANLTELATMLKVTPSTILTWASRYPDFPKAVAELRGAGRNGISRLYPIDEVKAWATKSRKTNRKGNEWTSILTKLSKIAKSSPATYKIILEMIDEASRK